MPRVLKALKTSDKQERAREVQWPAMQAKLEALRLTREGEVREAAEHEEVSVTLGKCTGSFFGDPVHVVAALVQEQAKVPALIGGTQEDRAGEPGCARPTVQR